MAIKFNHNLTKIRDPKTGQFIPLPSMSGPKGDPGKDATDEQVKASVESYMQNSPELTNIMKKIDTIWIQSDITDEERTNLITLAREKEIENLFKTTDELKTDMKTLFDKITKLEGREPEQQPEPEEYPEYKQPTGAHDAYHKDDKVTFNGERYLCIAPEGVAVVWDPIQYPAYWQKVE